MSWVVIAIGAALVQAVGLAIKKHALRAGGVNDIVAFFVFAVAALILASIYYATQGTIMSDDVMQYPLWRDIMIAVIFSVIGVMFSFRALDMADLSYLSPYAALGLLVTTATSFFLFGEIPTQAQFMGIGAIIAGSLIMEYRAHERASYADKENVRRNRKAMAFFFISIVAYSIPPAWQKSAVLLSDPLFVGFVTHGLMALCFVGIIMVRGGFQRLRNVGETMPLHRFVTWTAVAGIFAALANGSTYYAFQEGPVAGIIALKRLMPIFTFVLGVYVFKEHFNVRRRLIATCVMVGGAILIALG